LSTLGQESPLPLRSKTLPGTVYNITLVTDCAPDLTDIDSYLRSITSQYATPQKQALAIWRWSQRLRKQTTNPMEESHFVLDPIRMFNSYGYAARYVRITCQGRKGEGMLFSELQVFDHITVDRDIPPLVVLPPTGGTDN
jgi:hypothetical protein